MTLAQFLRMKSSIAIFLFVFIAYLIQCCTDKRSSKVLIIGNSITRHGPLPSEGWYGNWGMAASSEDKDFVNVLMKKIDKDSYNVIIKVALPSHWERDFNYDFNGDSMFNFMPDVLIYRLGENVPDSLAQYAAEIKKLIDRFHAKKVIVSGTFWPMLFKDSVQAKVAKDNGYEFVDLKDIWGDSKYQAVGQFKGGGVAAHPSDSGMVLIAYRLYDKLKIVLQ